MTLAGNVITNIFTSFDTLYGILFAAGLLFAVGLTIALLVYLFGPWASGKTAQNLEPFFDDEKLEGPKLERTLGLALLVAAVIAIAVPVYFAWEPSRQAAEANGFTNRSVARGTALYANAQMPQYNAAVSLGCANCHGAVVEDEKTGKLAGAGGGVANAVVKPTRENCTPEEQNTVPACKSTVVAWAAPALNTVMLRYPREQVYNILVYGRPGSPMPAWGVDGGGSKNEQALNDIIDFLYSIQLSPEEAKAVTAKNADLQQSDISYMNINKVNALITETEGKVTKATAAVAAATNPDVKALAEKELFAAENGLVHLQERKAKLEQLAGDLGSGDAQRVKLAQGQLLFESNCARCHTRGWSYYTPENGQIPLPAPEGSGAFGPSLAGGSTRVQFPDPKSMAEFVYAGALANKPYGIGGVGSGQMPGFGIQMTAEQIDQVVAYERDGLLTVSPANPGYALLKGASK